MLKRFISIIAVCLIITSCLITPTLAFDYGEGISTGTPLTPFYDYDYIEITSLNYDDMQTNSYLFNLKEVFYNVPIDRTDGEYGIVYTLNDLYGSGRDLQIILGNISLTETKQYRNYPVWTYEFYIQVDNEEIQYIKLHGREGFYHERSYQNIFSDSIYACDSNGSVLDIGWYNYIDITYDGSVYYPTYSYDEFGNIKGRQLNTYNIISNIMQGDDGDSVSITPYYDLNDINDLYPDTNTDPLIYFSEFTTEIVFPELIPGMEYLLFEINYVYPNSLNSAKQFYDKYFPAYEFIEGNVDFVGWLRSAVGGVFDLRIAPNITLGAILAFFLGVSAFIAFLKFFAGG